MEYYIGKAPETSALSHYGILGMKWGVRRYQNRDGSLTIAGKKRYSDNDLVKKQRYDNKSNSSVTKEKYFNSSDTDENKGLTEKQKKAIIIGATIAATALAAYGGYKCYQLYTGSGIKIDPETGFRLLDNMSDKEILSGINPGRIKVLSKTKNLEIISGSSTNCMLCTTAYELRKRGFDVHAGFDKSYNGLFPNDVFPKIFKNYKGTTKILNDGNTTNLLRNIEKYAESQGNGSRGNIICYWFGGGGHSMIWENINGKIIFKDGQTNNVYHNFAEQILKYTRSEEPIEMLRTDNLVVDYSEAKRFLNTDTLFKTYVDNGGNIALNIATGPVGSFTLPFALSYGTTKLIQKKAIDKYKKEHPKTKLSDNEIAKLLKNQKR